MSDILVLLVFLTFFFFGLKRPHVAFIGYIYVDTVVPQRIVFGFLHGQSLSLVMGIFCILSLLLNIRKLKSPVNKFPVFLIVALMIWITVTTILAEFQTQAWTKWDTTIKTLLMALLLSYVINSKRQLEAALLVFLLSVLFFVLSAGTKSLLGGGGYGRQLIVGAGNSGIAESSSLAVYALLIIPLILFLRKHATLTPQIPAEKHLWFVLILLCIATMVGTTARTGLVALAAYLGYLSLSKKYFLKGIFSACLIALIILLISPESWKSRMDTIDEANTENSALGRIVVWKWTVDYVNERPIFGGGFESYLANYGQLGEYDPIFANTVKAFHSIYFELLGEQGYVGFIIYFILIFQAFRINRKILCNSENSEWSRDLANKMNHMFIIFLAGGAFIGIGYRPIIFQLIALTLVHSKLLRERTSGHSSKKLFKS